MKIYLGIFFCVGKYFGKKTWDFIKKVIIMTHVFIYILEIRELLDTSFVDEVGDAYWFNILEALF